MVGLLTQQAVCGAAAEEEEMCGLVTLAVFECYTTKPKACTVIREEHLCEPRQTTLGWITVGA